jgi:glycine/D-amino acid oxidase-like deaminating enzyme
VPGRLGRSRQQVDKKWITVAMSMCVGVLGGGLQGCCVALALAERGANVVLFDKNDALLSRTAVANEGKIHLGYMYAGDPTLSTAKTMMAGALSFAPSSNVTWPAGAVVYIAPMWM